jgi:hypothetical protein
MRKIPTLFVRAGAPPSHVLPSVTRGCEWVLAGEGRATRKFDGTCCLIRDGVLYRRATVKPGRPAPDQFELIEVDTATGKRYGWTTIEPGKAGDPYREAWADLHALGAGLAPDGTYELVGPKFNANPDRFASHRLIRHGWALDPAELVEFTAAPRTFELLGYWLQARAYEGIVWHHPDGRMAKLKTRDYPSAGLRHRTLEAAA